MFRRFKRRAEALQPSSEKWICAEPLSVIGMNARTDFFKTSSEY